MTETSYRECNRCVMDTTDPDITFDSEGRCNHCRDYFDRLANLTYREGASDLERARLVAAMKESGRGREYDCLLGISGGIDSTYAAYTIKRLGLRALCVHLDNGWDSEISVKNIKHTVSKLGFGYQSFVLDWEEFKDLQVAFLKASVPEAETPTDIAIQGVVYRTAAEHGIKHIVSGGNFATEGILPKRWHYDAKDLKYLNAIHKLFGAKKLHGFPVFGYRQGIYYFLKGIKTVYLLNYVPYSKKSAMQTLERELAWKYYGGKHYESKYTGFIQSFVLYEKFKIDYRRSTLSTQICAGEVSRADALAELSRKPYDALKIKDETEYVCKKLGLTVPEFERIMAEPPKSHLDYPNNQPLLEFIYRSYRRLRLRKF